MLYGMSGKKLNYVEVDRIFYAIATFSLAPFRNCSILSGAENKNMIKTYGSISCLIRRFP